MNERFRSLIEKQSDFLLRAAVGHLAVIHEVNVGSLERYRKDKNGMVRLDVPCYHRARLQRIPATVRASAHFLIEDELGIKVDIDLENLPCPDSR